ncbi:MAG: sulfurtransferase TusA family protein [Solirubrobacteraceae bacterium]
MSADFQISSTPAQTLDVKGKACPLPVIGTAKAIKALQSGEILEVLATDPGVEADMHAWARQTGNELLSIEQDGGAFRVLLRKA